MRILHGPQNISGMAYSLARSQRLLGYDSVSVTNWNPTYKFKSDRWIETPGGPPGVDLKSFLKKEIFDFDVFHYYFGVGFSGLKLAEIPKLAKMKKKVFMMFCGCDVRDSKFTSQSYETNICAPCWPQSCSPNRALSLEMAKDICAGTFVSTVDLLDVAPWGQWLPQPVDVQNLEQLTDGCERSKLPDAFSADEPMIIAHVPSDPGKKGSWALEAAVDDLRERGFHVELRMVTGVTHKEAMRLSLSSHVVVDQLIAGVYGSYAAEMMSLGLPVIAFMRDSWRERYGEVDVPIINADPGTIGKVLEMIYSGELDLEQARRNSRAFALSVHDAIVVASRAISAYEEA